MRRYLLTSDAETDIDVIRAYLVREAGPPAVRRVLARIQEALRLLGDTPDVGHRRQDLTDDPVKFWQVFSYMIVYDPAPRPVHILRVLHSSRDVATLLGKQR